MRNTIKLSFGSSHPTSTSINICLFLLLFIILCLVLINEQQQQVTTTTKSASASEIIHKIQKSPYDDVEDLDHSSSKRSPSATSSSSLLSSLLCGGHNNKQVIRIACIGDSITRGDGSHEKNPWGNNAPYDSDKKWGNNYDPKRGNYPKYLYDLINNSNNLKNVVKEEGYNNNTTNIQKIDVQNFGRGGATACNSSDIAYIKSNPFRAALKYQPNIIVVMLGTNDARKQFWDNPPCGGQDNDSGKLYIPSIQQIISSFTTQQRQPPVVLLIPPPTMVEEMKFGIIKELLPKVRTKLYEGFGSKIKSDEEPDNNNNDNCRTSLDENDGKQQQLVYLADELDIPSDSNFFTKDQLHLNTKGSFWLACHVLKSLFDMASLANPCSKDDKAGSSNMNNNNDGDGSNGNDDSSSTCVFQKWEMPLQVCQKFINDATNNNSSITEIPILS